MTTFPDLRAATVRRRTRTLVALVVAGGSLLVSGSGVGADQTVYFDDAGDAASISLIGDSTLTGVRWYSDYGALERFNFVFSAESCRRTIAQSCISREGYRSATVVAAMRALDGELGEVLVVMSGYNDPVETIDDAIAAVVDEAREQAVAHVVWLTLRTSDDVDYSDPQEQSSVDTFREYNEQLVAAAASSGGYLQVADWATYSTGATGWFEADGVHLTRVGVDVVTTFIADVVAQVLAGQDVSPAAAPWSLLMPGAEGTTVAAVQEALIAAGVELPGGADGVYGSSTMVAVAEFQRRTPPLRQSGAVDEATARALGVYDDDDEGATATTLPTATVATAPSVVARGAAAVGSTGPASGPARWPVVVGVLVVVLVAASVGRRRYVVAQRAARRWARVHPATSPRRSVADMRRAGELPDAAAGIYDHQAEEPATVGTPSAVATRTRRR